MHANTMIMRLKFLFFPLMLVISVSLFIGKIWPGIQDVKKFKKQYEDNQIVLKDIQAKRENIKNMNADLDKNTDNKVLVFEYLPEKRNEEKIIYNLNHLAAGSGLSVLDISLEKGEEPVVSVAPVVSEGVQTPLTTVNPDEMQTITDPNKIDPSLFGTSTVVEIKPSFTKAHVMVVGEYEKLRMYLDQVQKMELYSMIESVKIEPQKAEGDTQNPEQPQATGALLLVGDINIDFGYTAPIKSNITDPTSFTMAKFDYAPVEKLRALITQKIPAIQVGASGKDNPFLP